MINISLKGNIVTRRVYWCFSALVSIQWMENNAKKDLHFITFTSKLEARVQHVRRSKNSIKNLFHEHIC